MAEPVLVNTTPIVKGLEIINDKLKIEDKLTGEDIEFLQALYKVMFAVVEARIMVYDVTAMGTTPIKITGGVC
jgi:hypothetical protein